MTNEAKLRDYLKRATADLDKAHRRLGELESRGREPIAIVGMSCRYPGGVSSPDDLWDLLATGTDAISEFPSNRGWDLDRLFHPDPDHAGTSYAREGGFLHDADEFDAEFFGIAPREALSMDPQQRLLLEAAWEAFEDAGIAPASLHGSRTGVFAGFSDQGFTGGAFLTVEEVEGHRVTGAAGSVASGRIAYALGLQGPAITVDTACSSSLVTLHLAAQALRGGECDMALAAGVATYSTPVILVDFARQRALSPDGRCKSFSDTADGTGFSEGVGMLVLERLSDAQRNGHQVLATIKGSAVNQDGASNGLTAPNGPSQERVIRQALANARLTPQDVDAVEAHGTGTTLGDPIEAGALLATYGQDREEPLRLGSIKSNIGHTQAAAGVVGVIKMAMAMREGTLPKTLHVEEPSSKVEWEAGKIELLTEAQEWKSNGKPRRAGVSSFGISGTNAHVILEEAPGPAGVGAGGEAEQVPGASSKAPLPGQLPLLLSAKTEPALQAQAARLATHLRDRPELDLADVAFTLATARTAFERRAVALGSDREELLEALDALAGGASAPGALTATARAGKLAYLFSGQGSQRAGMGKELCESHSAYAEAFEGACEALSAELGEDLEEIVFAQGEEAQEHLNHTAYAQPALFATEVALYRLLESKGLKADLLAGHSVGEISAAHIAGVLSLADAARLVVTRGRLMGALPEGGAMLAVAIAEPEAQAYLQGKEQELAIAAVNGPASIVLSGAEAAIEAADAHWQQQDKRTKRLAVSHAFHSPLIEPMLDEFEAVVRGLDLQAPQVPIVSNLSGEILSAEQATDPAYWVSHARGAVRFMDSVATLRELGATTFLEVGPGGALVAMAQECLDANESPAAVIPTLRKDSAEPHSLLRGFAEAHATGASPDWSAFFAGSGAKRVALPTYAFQRKRYWLSGSPAGNVASAGIADPDHPLLGATIESADGEGLTLTGRLSLSTHPWLADHAVAGAVLLPGAAFAELALRAGEEAGAGVISDLTLEAPLIIPELGAIQLQIAVSDPQGQGERELSIHSRPEAAEDEEPAEWTLHAQGLLAPEAQEMPEPLTAWPPPGAEPLDVEDLYERLADVGLEYGPAFQGLTAAWQDGGDLYAEVSLPEEHVREARRFSLHPALLDAALHTVVLATEDQAPKLPFSWSGVSVGGAGAQGLRVKLRRRGEAEISLTLADPEGNHVARVDSLALRAVDTSQLQGAGSSKRDGLLGIEWRELNLEAPSEEATETKTWRPERSGGSGAGAAREAAQGALEAIQAHLAEESKAETRLVILTEGAVAAGEGDAPDPVGAALWGLVRSAQSEHPGRFALVDTDGSEASDAAFRAAIAQSEESQLALREGVALAPRAVPLHAPGEDVDGLPVLDPDKTVLITGATGGLGALVARHLASEHGARHLLLLSRSGEGAEGAKELQAELEELGATPTIAACDVSDRKQLGSLISRIPPEHPLGTIIHTAGVLDDGMVEAMSAEQLGHVFAPKADAAQHLHELSADADLDAFVSFSSVAGVLGGPGQANYAAANAYLDALAQQRAAQGLPATSIAWGPWGTGGGMAAGLDEADLARMARSGVEALDERQGLALFDEALRADLATPVALHLNRAGLRAQASAGALPSVLSGLVRAPRRRPGVSGSLATKLAALPEAERESHVLDLVRSEVAAVLGHGSATSIGADDAFKDLGFDSLAAVELRNRLGLLSGLRLPATVVFDYPNPATLASHLLAEATQSGIAQRAAVRAQATDEPIAIVGMACRYPGGVASPEGLWQLLATGADAISEFPADRGWDLDRLFHPDPDHAGTSYAREGGFLHDADEFDAEFFGIAPREALAMDPQQRLLLEAAWEGLEDAGIDPASLRGEEAGVFAGVMHHEYGLLQSPEADLEGYIGTGSAGSVASGRIAYALGLQGPAITVDTACSSSLVTLHLAAQALRGGECSLALAAGATALASPGVFTEFSRQRALSPSSRSKSFAEAADGVAWGEGVGMLVLERLSDAQRNGHQVLATIKGSAVNQDGASNGLTAPNGPSQERVIRQALANARLTPQDVDAVEAHGTGTTLGDPIEAGALLATYGQDREEPLRLGSIKSNIGHTQAAAGVAGVIKTVMAMREGVLPKTLHVDEPSSKVEWEAGKVELLTEAREWKANGKPRRAGVSSFGISGTNAHVILEEAPEPAAVGAGGQAEQVPSSSKAPLPGQLPLLLSAKTEPALQEQAARLASHLRERPELRPADVAYSLATTRSSFERRAVALGADREEQLGSLDALAQGIEGAGLIHGKAREDRQPVFLFPGQGSQWKGMALDLIEGSPAFERGLRECEEALSPHIEWSVREVLSGAEGAPPIERIEVVQPVLFAVTVSLAEAWRACGVVPAAVVGHSQGEIAAAHIAGGLSLQEAAMLAAVRSQIISRLAGEGAMVSVALPPQELESRLERWQGRIEIAAQNGPSSTVLSADREAIDEFLPLCAEEGVRAREVPATIASHSARVEPLREELLDALASLSPQSGEIPLHSTVTGEPIDTAELGPEYWYRNLREPVRFEEVTRSLIEQGHRAFIEVSPHPVFALALGETVEDALPDPSEAAVLGTLRRDEGTPARFALSLAEAHAQGVKVEWSAFFAGSGAESVALPTYAFQRKRYWLSGSGAGNVASAGIADLDHPLLGAAIEDPRAEGIALTGRISLSTHPWLAEHAVAGTVLLPGAAFAELALRAAEEAGAQTIAELTLQAPLLLFERGAVQLQVRVSGPDEKEERELSIHSRPETAQDEEPAEWTCHAQGLLAAEAQEPPALAEWPPPAAEPLGVEDLYDRLADVGLEYGPTFQGLTAAWRQGEDVYAEVSLPEEASSAGFGVHPALLDAALHTAALAGLGEGPMLPFSWSGVSLHASGARDLRVKLSTEKEGEVSLELADAEGMPLARVGSLTLRAVDPSQLQGAKPRRRDGLLEIEWQQLSLHPAGHSEPGAVETWRPEPAGGAGARAAREAAEATLEVLQGWLSREHPAEARLAILTEGAVAASEGESPDPAGASVWGLVRSAQSEHPGRFALVDTDGSEASAAAVEAALAVGAEEPQIALRDGEALVARATPARGGSLIPPPGPWHLDPGKSGSLEGLSLVSNPDAERPLAPTEVRIEMRAAGLNFREVLAVLGYWVPAEGILGGEGAGVVLEVGAEVTDFVPGDRVMGTVPDAFAPLAVTERQLVIPLPESWSFQQGAAIPTVFTTVYYGLFDLAALKPGERILIHAAAGGVGMAAVQIAHHLGAEVFATASPAKWEVLEGMGIPAERIASSRNLEFKDAFLAATDGEGVDVVLNSLAGEFIDASLEVMPRGGRFVEMGVTDIRDSSEIAATHPGVSYCAFDIVHVEVERRREMLSEIVELIERGDLCHSPISRWDIRRAPEAFRHLREGHNVGKVVLDVPQPLDPDKTVLITGATGGLGALVARHLASEHGARHLLLLSRSGSQAEGAVELRTELEGLGAEVTIASCNVSDRQQLQGALGSISPEHPLGAVIHAAGALDDSTVEAMSAEQLGHVFAPKADAAQHLHELSADADLSAFVLYSSAAGVLGAPGQANYAAANAYLDALATRRRAEGRPAASIAWGLWEQESAMTSHLNEADLARMSRSGIEALSAEQGLALFEEALRAEQPAPIALALNRASLRAAASAGMVPPLLSGLVSAPARRQAVSGSLATKLAALPEAERESHVLDLVRSEVAAVLGHGSATSIGADDAFKDLGFDSLAAVELRNRLGAASGLRLSTTVVFDYPSPATLASHLLAEAMQSGIAQRAAVRAQATDEPIAIVGMACRYPGGVASPGDLWNLLTISADAISEFPADRGWDLDRLFHPDPDHAGTSYAREGGFLHDADEFDAEFFGIAPREALAMDPQQRLLLEAAWEGLEDAGIDPASLRGEEAGVFAGISSQDYTVGAGIATIEGYVTTGNVLSVASGRIAYALGLQGPAITVDTACSSSLVAMHLASGALRGGECSLALAAGVTILATPTAFTEFSRQRGLAPDGRCKAFAEAADGTGFSEGVGMLVLERLSDAQRNGHQVLATIKGSAVNQDGASNGLTAPNGPSQERVIRQALANARLTPQDVDAVEAHGTGTTLGDPIEAGALLATYGQDREEPLRLGSIKSNIGHTQAAAGVAGVIKTVMAMREGVLPKTLHVDEPSSKVEWEAGKVELLTEAREWKANGKPRRAGVSSFGISGTNAHVILEEAPEPAAVGAGGQAEQVPSSSKAPLPGQLPLLLSAKTEPALQEQAARLASHLRERPELRPADVAYSLATTRSSFERRAVALGADREEQLGSLDALAQGIEGAGLIHGKAREDRQPVFLFPGQGSQWKGMALDLIEGSPAFERGLRECEEALSPHIEWSVREVLSGAEGAPPIERIEVVQPVLFAVTVSLAEAWRACGVVPAAVVGHSQGEIAAAHIAGGLSLQEAAMLAAVRSQIISRLAGEGAMVSVALPPQELESRLERWQGRIEIAAQNGPSSTVLSADREAIDEFLPLCAEEGVRAREVPATIASHSARVEPLREELLDALASLSPQSGEIPLHSTVTGEPIDTAELGPEYWYRNLREPVRFEEVTRSLIEQGHRAFIEVSPHPVFALALGETVEDALPDPSEAAVLGTLRRDEGTPARFALSLAEAHAQGVKVEWSAFFAGSGAESVALPTYAFQRKRYWLSGSGGGNVASAGIADLDHPLLGAAIEDPRAEGIALTGRISLSTHPWLAEHAVAGTVLLPGAAFAELALRAAEEAGAQTIAELTLQAPLLLFERGAVQLQVRVSGPDEKEERELSIHSRPETAQDEEPAEWTCHAQGLLAAEAQEPPALAEWPPPAAEPLGVEDLYDRLADVGLEYGPTFQGLTAAWRQGEDVYAEVSLPEEASSAGFGVHPALLDAALHTAALAGLGEGPMLPFSWSGVSLHASGARDLRVKLSTEKEGEVSLELADAEGMPLARVGSLTLRAVDPSQLQGAKPRRRDGLLEIEWQQLSLHPAGHSEPGAVETWRPEPAGGAGARAAREAAEATLEVLQGWLSREHPAEARLAILTEGAVAASEGESPDPAGASVWGLVRSAQSEHPGRFALVDTDGSEASAAAVEAALAVGAEEPQIALRDGEALVARAVPLQAPGEDADGLTALDPDKTVLITGATGGLGALVARHLASEHGARHLLLLSRSGSQAEGAVELRTELEGLGAEVTIASCNVSDRQQLQGALGSISPEHPLGAVIHAAGALDDSTVEAMSAEQLGHVFAPKADAAQHLHELSADADLSAFVLYSSAAGVLGAPGQANYAAANAYLDALATRRRAEGRPAASIAWGLWEQESAMTSHLNEADLARMSRSGIEALSAEQGLALFEEALRAEQPAPIALALNRASLRAAASAGMVPPLLSGLVSAPARRQAVSGSLATKLAALPEAERESHVLDLVRSEVAAVLGHGSATSIGADDAFKDLGFDSLAAVELRNRLGAASGLRLAATVVFDHPNVAALAAYLLKQIEGLGETGLQGKLEQFEEALGAVPAADPGRRKLALHLRALAADLEGGSEQEGPVQSMDERLESASDEELLDFIDEQVGGGNG